MRFFYCLLIGLCTLSAQANCPAPTDAQVHQVTKVYDGDTIAIQNNNKSTKVRLLGVNTPEKSHRTTGRAEPFANVASDFLRQFIERDNNAVGIGVGEQKYDTHKRTLAWVFSRNGTLYAEILLRRGLGYHVATFADERFVSCLQAAENDARINRRGVWSQPATRVRHQVPTGFAVVQGRAMDIKESKRAYWVNLDGDLVLQFNKKNWRNRAQWVKTLVGKSIVVQGWIAKRRKPSRRYKNHILSVMHPAMLRTL